MPRNQLGHLKHADLLLAVEHGLQVTIGVDERFFLRILQPILADVSPKLFRQLGPRKRFVANNFGERLIRRDRFHERCVGRSLCLFRCFSHASICPIASRKANLISWNPETNTTPLPHFAMPAFRSCAERSSACFLHRSARVHPATTAAREFAKPHAAVSLTLLTW